MNERHPSKGRSVRHGEKTHISKSPRGDPRRKPKDACHFLNQKPLSQGFDARHILKDKPLSMRNRLIWLIRTLLGSTVEPSNSWSPSSRRSWNPLLPKKSRPPPLIEQFVGLTDPDDHTTTYKAQISVQTSCEAT